MKVIEVTHPIQSNQFITENVAMAFGFFDGMHRGHDKVFQVLDEKAKGIGNILHVTYRNQKIPVKVKTGVEEHTGGLIILAIASGLIAFLVLRKKEKLKR